MLRIYLFGHLQLFDDQRTVPFSALPKVLPLWAYLLLHRDRTVPRAYLAGLLWDDVPESEALANLRRHLHELRRVLPPAPEDTPWIQAGGGGMQWNPAAEYWLDVAEFERLSAQPDNLAEAVDLYTGDLLPNVYDDWCIPERERLHHMLLADLNVLVNRQYAQGELVQALKYAQVAQRHDPLNEDFGRRLIGLHYASGDRASAVQTYQRLVVQLRQELGVEPMPETQAVYNAVVVSGTLPEDLFGQSASSTSTTTSTPSSAHAAPSSTDPSSTFMLSTVPAGTVPAGTVPPTAVSPTSVPSSSVPPTTVPPATMPPTNVPPTHFPPTNLPAQVTAFVGRTRELATVRQLLAGEQGTRARLLTLTGPGGTGKTRLSQAVASWLREHQGAHFPDGIYVVDLSALLDAALVPQAIAETLGVRATGERALTRDLCEYLGPRRLLLVLDNFEQILGAAPTVAEILSASPGLTVLVTSRAPLHLYGEVEFPVPPLDLPVLDPLPAPDALAEYSAVALYEARAKAANPSFALTLDTGPAVAELCIRFDGLPLAIELLAAHSRFFTPAALLTRLTDRPAALSSRESNRPARHQTLHQVVDWSYRLLSDSEKRIFARLAVFAGSFGLGAAEAVLVADEVGGDEVSGEKVSGNEAGARAIGADAVGVDTVGANAAGLIAVGPGTGDLIEGEGVLDALLGLVEKSMLVGAPSPMADGGPRFRMLVSLREYGLAMLAQQGDEPVVRARHAQHYLNLAENARNASRGPQQGHWLVRLDEAHDNLRAAIAWFDAQPDGVESQLRLAAALQVFWDERCYFEEARSELGRALARAAGSPPSRALTRALNSAATFALRTYDGEAAQQYGETCLAMARALADDRGVASALNILAGLASRQGNFAKAESLLEESLAILHKMKAESSAAVLLGNLGILAFDQRHYEVAQQRMVEALALSRAHSDQQQIVLVEGYLSVLACQMGDADLAHELANDTLTMAASLGDPWNVACSEQNLGSADLARGKLDDARGHFGTSWRIFRKMDDISATSCLLAVLAHYAIAENRPGVATQLLAAANHLHTQHGIRLTPHDQANFDHDLTAARDTLGEAAFAAAWAEGQVADPDEVVAPLLVEAGAGDGDGVGVEGETRELRVH